MAGIASVETTQEIGSKENHYDGPQPDAGATTVTPAAVAVVPSTATQNQQQNDNEYQHIGDSFPLNVTPQPDRRKSVLPATVFIRRSDWLVRSIVLRPLFLIAQIEFVAPWFPKGIDCWRKRGEAAHVARRTHQRTGVAVYILFHRAIENNMASQGSSWIRRRAEQAMKIGLLRAYRGVGVNPERYLNHLRRAYGLHVTSFREMNTVPLPVVDYLADKTMRASMKMAMLEGAGAGLGGILSILPDVGFLGGITWRMIQKLSLLHGFEYASEDDMAELWLAVASAAGVDMGKDLVRKQVIERFVPRIIECIAARAGTEMAENGLFRLVPVLGSVMGGTLNYYFVRGWGQRAQRHFRERHLLLRSSLRSLPFLDSPVGEPHTLELSLSPLPRSPTLSLPKGS